MYIRRLQAQSFRTLTDIDISFNARYTAICGKNNSGKSNIVRALRAVLGSPGPFEQRDIRLSKSDRTAWDAEPHDPVITLYLELDWNKDGELLQFISRLAGDGGSEPAILQQANPQMDEGAEPAADEGAEPAADEGAEPAADEGTEPVADEGAEPVADEGAEPAADEGAQTTSVVIRATLDPQSGRESIAITLNGNELDSYATQETMRKIRSSTCYLFHNSTTTPAMGYGFREESVGAVLDRLSSGEKEKLRQKRVAFVNELDKAMLSHGSQITDLLGRLSDKYDVKIAIHDQVIDYLPFDISLSYQDKALAVPLDDWGSGTRNRTLILQKLITARQSSEPHAESHRILPVVLLEEPESFLHPPAQAEFGNVLQDLADEFGVQVIATSHSPYMLSHKDASANILLSRAEKTRKVKDGEKLKIRETYIVDTNGDNWRQPFELALGTCGPEFEYLKEAIFANSAEIILVEGPIDKGYLEMLMSEEHGKNQLKLRGAIVPYEGVGSLKNGALVRFIKDRFSKLIVTCDLDFKDQVLKDLAKCSISEFDGFVAIGVDEPGRRCIEGLVPQRIKEVVQRRNPALVDAITSDKTSEVKEAKAQLKGLYLDEFRSSASAEGGDFSQFYALTKSLNGALGR